MHLGKRYTFAQFLGWTGWEALYLVAWSLLVTAILEITRWDFLATPAPVLTIVGSALAIILAFKNQQCYARYNEALELSGQLTAFSLIFANRLRSTIGALDAETRTVTLHDVFNRHFAWLTALRYFLRERKAWENTTARGNARFLRNNPTPESQSTLEAELKTYLRDADVERVLAYTGDREALLLRWQYDAVSRLYNEKQFSEYILIVLTAALDDLARVQGALKRTKNYPYARNYYSIAVFLVTIFVALVPFGLLPHARELGQPEGIGHLTAWLNVPFSAVVGWIFVSLEKVGENSSNPFEGGANDVPVSAVVRRIEIEMRSMLGEAPSLKPIEAKDHILF